MATTARLSLVSPFTNEVKAFTPAFVLRMGNYAYWVWLLWMPSNMQMVSCRTNDTWAEQRR